MAICVTLVHGTWARNAPWTQSDSFFCTELARRIGEPVIFRQFNWSGRNSFSGRSKAAIELLSYLREGIEQNPSSKQVIIAHSHGGNIVLYALRDDDKVRRRIHRVVCLSTPFIIALRRDFGENINLQTRSLAMASRLIVAILICGVLPYFRRSLHANHLLACFQVFLAAFFLSTLMVFAVQDLITGFVSKRKNRVFKELEIPRVEKTKLLVIRSTADEASLALTATQFAAWLATKSWKILSAPFGFFDEWAARAEAWADDHMLTMLSWGMPVGFLVTGAFFVVLLRSGSTWLTRGDWFWFVLGGAATVTGMCMVLSIIPGQISKILNFIAGLLLAPLYLILTILTVPFSPELAFALWEVQLTVESTPTGKCRVVQISCAETTGLRHSSPYSDSRAIEEIVNWIRPSGR
jgi:hypothetical protein